MVIFDLYKNKQPKIYLDMKKIFLIFNMVFLGIQGYAQKTETDKEFIKWLKR